MGRKVIERNKICMRCNKPFDAYSKTAKYCSNGCRTQAYKLRHGIPFPDFDNIGAIRRVPSTTERLLVEKINENKEIENRYNEINKKVKDKEIIYNKAKKEL